MQCQELDHFLDVYLDGEFDERETTEVEHHLAGCDRCHGRAAAQAHLRALVRERARVPAPERLADRIRSGLDSLEREGSEAEAQDLVLFGPDAAGEAWFVAARRATRRKRSASALASVGVLSAVLVAGGLWEEEGRVAEDAISRHVQALPVEVIASDTAGIEGWARDKVDFNPRVPRLSRLQPMGARLSHVLEHPAVSLAYGDGSGHRASLFVFRDPGLDLTAEPGASRRIAGRELRLTSSRGYNVVLWRDQGIAYGLVSDLDTPELVQLVADGWAP